MADEETSPGDEERLSEAIEHKRAMSAMLVSDGWRILSEILEADASRLTESALKPITDIAIILAAEHEKGSAFAFRKILTMPQTLLDIATEDIEAYKEKEEDNG